MRPHQHRRNRREACQPTNRDLERANAPFVSELPKSIDLIVDRVSERRAGGGRGGRRLLATCVLAREDPVAERPPGQQANAIPDTRGNDLCLDAAIEQAVLPLGANEARRALVAGDPLGLDDLPGGKVGRTYVADLAFLD